MQLILLLVLCFSAALSENEEGGERRIVKRRNMKITRVNDHVDKVLLRDVKQFDTLIDVNKKYISRQYNKKIENLRPYRPRETTTKRPATRIKAIMVGRPRFQQTTERSEDQPVRKIIKENPNLAKSKKGKNITIGNIKRLINRVQNIKKRSEFYHRNVDQTKILREDSKKDIERPSENVNAQKSLLPSLREKSDQVGFPNLLKTGFVGETEEENPFQTEESPILPNQSFEVKPVVQYIENRRTTRKPESSRRISINTPVSKQFEKYINNRNKQNPAVWTKMIPLSRQNAANTLDNPPKQMTDVKVHENDNSSVADDLAKKVRILCWVMTHPNNHNKTIQPIKDTWGKRCTKLLFMSTEHDPVIGTVKLNVKEGRGNLWPKARAAFEYVSHYYGDQYDWFLRADDDTYMVMENLRYLLGDLNPKEPLYIGCRFKRFATQGYMSGGAGVVLSRAALKKLMHGFDEPDMCDLEEDLENDDVNLGKCLNRMGVKALDSRDAARKGRFLVFMPRDYVSPNALTWDKSFWYWQYIFYPTETGMNCCSDYVISFHYVSPQDMYALEYLIYRVRVFGIQKNDGPIPSILDIDETKIEKPMFINDVRKHEMMNEKVPSKFVDYEDTVIANAIKSDINSAIKHERGGPEEPLIYSDSEEIKGTTLPVMSAMYVYAVDQIDARDKQMFEYGNKLKKERGRKITSNFAKNRHMQADFYPNVALDTRKFEYDTEIDNERVNKITDRNRHMKANFHDQQNFERDNEIEKEYVNKMTDNKHMKTDFQDKRKFKNKNEIDKERVNKIKEDRHMKTDFQSKVANSVLNSNNQEFKRSSYSPLKNIKYRPRKNKNDKTIIDEKEEYNKEHIQKFKDKLYKAYLDLDKVAGKTDQDIADQKIAANVTEHQNVDTDVDLDFATYIDLPEPKYAKLHLDYDVNLNNTFILDEEDSMMKQENNSNLNNTENKDHNGTRLDVENSTLKQETNVQVSKNGTRSKILDEDSSFVNSEMDYDDKAEAGDFVTPNMVSVLSQRNRKWFMPLQSKSY